MHELGVVIEVVKTVSNFARNNGVTKVDTIVLQIGELSSMIPRFIEECYPAAVDGTAFEKTKLKIEILPANAMCKQCHHVFNVIQNRSHCPECHSAEWGLLGGKEFTIKEIIAC
ncbi:hydrogenase maturation nickel metallochaperone HypA [Vibrio tapetis subsp. quintayensis]|uniref:hydrogenase maturation nickel metallochaperone HypA/HybF n=1 Tax=Vibrio tapetis TaxID=52443 RepID=UPI0025B30412|nr:hydrogenase maturation nickel metallochaperone HypA [Vibrio tapetis]MDN3678776.1 hydrogenase maturation nickel metallochaperone HypA [Vibrio tapetis subsp. quintayensis]